MPVKGKSVTVQVVAWDTSANAPKAGDAANLTIRAVGDGAEFTPAGTPTQVDATNLPGVYKVALTAAENDHDVVIVGGKSSTANVVVVPFQFANLFIPDVAVRGTVSDGSPGSSSFKTTGLPALTLVGKKLVFTSGGLLSFEASVAGDDLGADPNRTLTLSPAFPAAPANGDSFIVIA